jgi:peptidoglycan/xylan/chitin deacetylase (PgdA/CDA1 family)
LWRVIFAVVATAGGIHSVATAAADSAVVFMYHRFGEQGVPATNIRVEQFDSHLRELAERRAAVIGLGDIVTALRASAPLPKRAVALSIDDAFKSVYTVAWPRLRAAGLPFTLFVSTDAVARRGGNYMSWDQIRELAKAGVTIGSQTASHLHMARSSDAKNRADIAKSNQRFVQELGAVPSLLAYPYGEASRAVRQLAIDAGFEAAFGQHSGVIHGESDFHFLPRFAMNESYGDVARFRLAASALPLTVRDVTPADPLLKPANNPPLFGFTVFGDALKGLRALACYASGQGKARLERLGPDRIEVRFKQAFPSGRARVNCTMPAGHGQWRWFGMQFYVLR